MRWLRNRSSNNLGKHLIPAAMMTITTRIGAGLFLGVWIAGEFLQQHSMLCTSVPLSNVTAQITEKNWSCPQRSSQVSSMISRDSGLCSWSKSCPLLSLESLKPPLIASHFLITEWTRLPRNKRSVYSDKQTTQNSQWPRSKLHRTPSCNSIQVQLPAPLVAVRVLYCKCKWRTAVRGSSYLETAGHELSSLLSRAP